MELDSMEILMFKKINSLVGLLAREFIL